MSNKVISLNLFVQGVVEKALEAYSKVKGYFVDMKHERTFIQTKISEDDGAIAPLCADAPKPDWFQIQIPGHPGQLVAIVGNGKVIQPITYEKDGEKRAKLLLRNGTVVHSWYRQIRAVYFAVQFRNGHPYLVKDERFVTEVPDYINGVTAVEDFLRKQGIPEDLVNVASKLSLVSPKQGNFYRRDKAPNHGIDISGKSQDGLPGVSVAHSEPGDELGGVSKTKTKTKDENNRGEGKPTGKPKGKTKSSSQLTADAKAGVVDPEADEAKTA